MNTNWSTPKTNLFAAMLNLRGALAAGQNARLIKMRNADCAYPIKTKTNDENFRNYEFSIGYGSTRKTILEATNMQDTEKHLTLNYKNCYGTQEAVDHYYKTGLLGPDNFLRYGRGHLVKVTDMVAYFTVTQDHERARRLREQYITLETAELENFYDFFRYKQGSQYAVKTFKRKLWVVELLKTDDPKPRTPVMIHVLNALAYPLKYIPTRSVLKMGEYKVITFRIGDVVNGLSIEFHVPKKFSFNN